MKTLELQQYIDGIRGGDRAVLARSITLIESGKSEHTALAQQVIQNLLPDTGTSQRVGVSGVPGAGKSTFVDVLGTMLTADGHQVAVLAVDPTSSISGGSILGDKTRMTSLARDPNAFIRPSPTGGTLGGVALKTRESILLCEAAGFDVVFVETVGVGQSETIVAGMVDFFLVLLIAGAGDELQGIKRGILEVADMLAITKTDGDNVPRAISARASYQTALRLMRGADSDWDPPVMTCSALEKTGLRELWDKITEHSVEMKETGAFESKRRKQQVRWMWDLVDGCLRNTLRSDAEMRMLIERLQDEVASGMTIPSQAARVIVKSFASRAELALKLD